MRLQPAQLQFSPLRFIPTCRRVSTLALAVLLTSCSSGPDVRDLAADRPDPIAVPTPISGIYDVSGVTRQIGGPERRPIAGTVTLRQEGDRYYATFKLATTFPGTNGPIHADVIGTGEGTISGRKLTAELPGGGSRGRLELDEPAPLTKRLDPLSVRRDGVHAQAVVVEVTAGEARHRAAPLEELLELGDQPLARRGDLEA